jgi:hypothetical protein
MMTVSFSNLNTVRSVGMRKEMSSSILLPLTMMGWIISRIGTQPEKGGIEGVVIQRIIEIALSK